MHQSKIRFSNYVDRDQLLKAQNLDAAGQLILFHFCKSLASVTIANNFAFRGQFSLTGNRYRILREDLP